MIAVPMAVVSSDGHKAHPATKFSNEVFTSTNYLLPVSRLLRQVSSHFELLIDAEPTEKMLDYPSAIFTRLTSHPLIRADKELAILLA